MMNWFYENNDKPVGPISETQMRAWVKHGALQPTQLVRKEGESEWKTASSCPEIFIVDDSPLEREMTKSLTIPADHTPETKPTKAPFLSIPGNPRIPALVRVYGTIIRLASAITIILIAILMIGGCIVEAQEREHMARLGITRTTQANVAFGAYLLFLLIQIIISGVLFVVAKLVRDGRRKGLHLLAVFAAFDIICGLVQAALAKTGGEPIAIMTFVVVALVLGPPIIVGYKNWSKFN